MGPASIRRRARPVPSSMTRTREAKDERSGVWVIMMMVVPFSWRPPENHHIALRPGVQVRGRLVREDEGGNRDEGPGDGRPLPVPAREMGRVRVGLRQEADLLQQVPRLCLHSGLPLECGRQEDVLEERERGDQAGNLEDEPHHLRPEDGPLVVRHGQEVMSGNRHQTGSRQGQAAEHVQEGRLAGPGPARTSTNSPISQAKSTPSSGRISFWQFWSLFCSPRASITGHHSASHRRAQAASNRSRGRGRRSRRPLW